MECLKCFAQAMIAIFWPVYLRKPTQVDIKQQLQINAKT